ncbi:MAG: DHA2 family efflux MFS transporter permease subunit [Bdellovibrionaceae bacterium]|nr:DHA2 family efflux MFS transporter permease subunit [Pseudobdellovibrionaceae bacterium]MBX3032481.1 DHA2 family efflux MFS transporter permease subunit [Pseudobdellovibrionaceae bacterium]
MSATAAPTSEETMSLRSWIAVLGAVLGAFMAILDIQITNASIREITGGLGATLDEASWISTSYLVAEIVIIPISGWLTRLLSLRVYLLWTSGLFLFFSVCCGLSWNLESMIVFRALQGLTGGALIPLAFQVILSLPVSKRAVGMTLFGLTATFAPAIGPAVGGYLTQMFHWSVVFYMNLLPGAFLIFAVLYGIDRRPKNMALLRQIDVWGIFSMAVGLSALTIFLEEGERQDWFSSRMIIALAVCAAVFIIAFLIIELRGKNPFIDLRLLLQKNFGFGCLVNFVVGLALYGALYLLPMYLSTIQRYNSVDIGKTMMWAGFPQLLVLPFVPRLLARFDGRWVAFIGINVFALSCLMNSHLTPFVGYEQLMWSQFVRALGQPLLMIPLSTITTGLIRPEQAGSASGLFNMLRNLGGSVGIALLGTMLSVREKFHSAKLVEGVNLFRPETRERLALMRSAFVQKGYDSVTAGKMAVGALDQTVRQQAHVMSFNDCFFFVCLALVAASLLILLCDPVRGGGSGEAH